MISEEHLQMSEILAFHERRLSATEHTTATRHLLQCSECRNRLPLPTADVFWSCLFGNDESGTEAVNSAPRISAMDFVTRIFGQLALRNAVLAGLLIFATTGLSWFLITPGGSSKGEKLVAAVGNTEDVGYPNTPFKHDRDEAANRDVSVLPPDTNRPKPKPGGSMRVISTRVPIQKESRTPGVSRASGGVFNQRVETRGKIPCGGQRFVGLEAKLTEKGLLLRWEKVRGAIAYNVYLSDLDEKLTEHFETPDKTSHLVTAELTAGTAYKLRLIVTLENGERVVSEPQNFKVGDLAKGLQSSGNIGIRNKTAASVRCVEVKQ